jgi:TonB-dependent starch-binding outer membrane protein SusC
MKSYLLKIKCFLSMLALMFFVQAAMAQITVTGTVSDGVTQETLIGATVRIQGTTTGTVTDIDGKYSINVPGPNAVLIVSYVGYMDEEVNVAGRTVINVGLMPSIEMLSEMVVIGYGVVRKSDLTGSVAVVTSEDLNRIPTSNFTQALQGRATGVMVTRSGSPGSNAQIRIRGVGSINANANPIYVIDGIITNSLNSVNPTDIESIQVLKDASAAAIYGADGANGVIIITTKRGESGKPRVNYSSYIVSNVIPRQFDMMNADEYANFYNRLYEERNILSPVAYSPEFRQLYYGDGWQTGTDWQDAVVRRAFGHNHNIRISGGGEGSNYSISANYYKEDGILQRNSAERFNIRANSDFNLGKYVKVGESFSITYGIGQSPTQATGAWSGTLIASPLMRIYSEDNKGGFDGPQVPFEYTDAEGNEEVAPNTGGNDKHNPMVSMMLSDNKSHNTNLLASIYMEVKPVSWFTYKITPSVDAAFGRMKNWTPSYESGVRSVPQAQLDENFYEGVGLSLENQVTFSNSFGLHNITATAVHHIRRSDGNSLQVRALGFPYENLNTVGMSFADGREVSGFYTPFASESYLGRIIYDYSSKYLITASIRRDGNSRFGPVNRWGTFPSVSAAWKINEDFLQSIDEISMLKLRVGWGQTGNSNIGNFQYQSVLDQFSQFSPVFGANQVVVPALNVIHSTGNPSIRWEAASMTNFGLDLNLFADKWQFSADYYIKNQDDLLVRRSLSLMFGRQPGAGDPWVNLGEVQNRGFEFSALYRKREGVFHYNISANMTTVKNEVKYIPTELIQANNKTTTGHTIGSLYGYVAERIITPADFDGEGNYLFAQPASGTPRPGDLMFKDLNNDGVINDLDRTIIGKAIPDLMYSLNLEFMYKGWDFSAFFYGMQNYQVYNHLRANIEGFSSQDLDHNKSRDYAMNYYREDRPSTTHIRADVNNTNQNNRASTWYLEDASFLRLKDIQIGWSLPRNLTSSLGISRARVYASAINIFTITKYTGRDPEAPTVSSPLTPGNDGGTYPVPRAYTFGIQVDI